MSEQCSVCNKKADLRPYGKNGALICYPCGMKNREQTSQSFAKLLGKGNALLTCNGPIPYIGRLPNE